MLVSDAIAAPGFAPVAGSPFAIGPFSGSVAFSADGSLFASIDVNSWVHMSSVASNGTLSQVAGSPFRPFAATNATSLAISPRDGLLVTADEVGRGDGSGLSVWSIRRGGTLTEVHGSPFLAPMTDSTAFSPDGRLLATGDALEGAVRVYRVSPGGTLTPVARSSLALGQGVGQVAFNRDGTLLAATNEIKNMRSVSVYAVSAGGALTPVPGSPFATGHPVSALAFSPISNLLATANTDNTLSVFTVSLHGRLSPVSQSPFLGVSNVISFSPNGGLLAAISAGDTVSVFSVSPRGTLSPIEGSPFAAGRGLESIAFSPTGGLLATDNLRDSTATVLSVAPPSAQIQSPPPGRYYALGQRVPTAISCAEAAYGPGLASCTDSTAHSAPCGELDTSSLGTHTYQLTAVSKDRQTATATISYTITSSHVSGTQSQARSNRSRPTHPSPDFEQRR